MNRTRLDAIEARAAAAAPDPETTEYNRRREMLRGWLDDDNPEVLRAIEEAAVKASIPFDDALRHIQSISYTYSSPRAALAPLLEPEP